MQYDKPDPRAPRNQTTTTYVTSLKDANSELHRVQASHRQTLRQQRSRGDRDDYNNTNDSRHVRQYESSRHKERKSYYVPQPNIPPHLGRVTEQYFNGRHTSPDLSSEFGNLAMSNENYKQNVVNRQYDTTNIDMSNF